MFRTKRDIQMIKKIEELLTKFSRERVEMTGTTEKGITFQNDMYSNFVVFLEVEKETFKILKTEITYLCCPIPRLEEIIVESYKKEILE